MKWEGLNPQNRRSIPYGAAGLGSLRGHDEFRYLLSAQCTQMGEMPFGKNAALNHDRV